jgi:hypothetical protein
MLVTATAPDEWPTKIIVRTRPLLYSAAASSCFTHSHRGLDLLGVKNNLVLKTSDAWARLSYPSPSMARYEIPKELPEFVECGDAFIPSNEATLEEWQRHKNPDNSVNQILKLAEKLTLPDNIPLLPRLRALARTNVLAFNRKF